MTWNLNSSKPMRSVIAAFAFVVGMWSINETAVCFAQTSAIQAAEKDHKRDTKQLLEDVRKLREEMRRLSEIVDRHLTQTQETPIPDTVTETTPSAGSTKPRSILYFTATWCGPCQQQGPIISKLKREGVPIQIVDIDLEGSLTRQYHISSIPTLVVERDGEEVQRIVGPLSENSLRDLVQEHGMTANPPIRVMQQRLKRGVTVVCVNQSIHEGLRQIKQQAEFDIVIDESSIEKLDINSHKPIYFAALRVTARQALRMLLKPRNLDFEVHGDVVVVTGKSAGDDHGEAPVAAEESVSPYLLEIYAVEDLLTPPGTHSKPQESVRPVDWLNLIEHIKETTSPRWWEDNGGGCTIKPYPGTNSLIIRATGAVHDRIHESLERLRRERFMVFETQFLKVPEGFSIEQASLNRELAMGGDSAHLSYHQVLRFMEYAKRNGGTVSAAPPITIPNGEVSELLSPHPFESQLHLRGLVLSDKNAFRVSLSTDSKQMISQLIERSYEVADGETLVLNLSSIGSKKKTDESGGAQYLLIRPRRVDHLSESESLIKTEDQK